MPPQVQGYIVFAAALHVANKTPAPAQAFIKFATDPVSRAQWQAGGLQAMTGH
jgi:hypothetical protein